MGDLAGMLDRCRAFEERAARLYRTYATAARAHPELCALWTGLAREEEEHARTLTTARLRLRPGEGIHSRIDGWGEALEEIEQRLAVADRLASGASADQQLGAALELEISELEALRCALLAASARPEVPAAGEDHAERLAQAATRLSTDPQVRLLAALLLARARLKR